MFDRICPDATWCQRHVVDATLEIALEIAREGRRIGTIFTLGRANAALRHSRPLILDTIALHPAEVRAIADVNLRGNIKELAQLDGAFVIDDAGTVVAACRYLDISAERVQVPLGLGSRHLAAASISKKTGTLAIVVSDSALVRVFHNGVLEAELLPELWLLTRHSLHLAGPVHQDKVQDIAIFTADSSQDTKT